MADANSPSGTHAVATSAAAYVTPYASSTRSSRVPVRPRPVTALTQVAALEAAPRFVLVDPSGAHLALDYGDHYELRAASGARLRDPLPKAAPELLLLLRDSYIRNGGEDMWAVDETSERMTFATDVAADGTHWASRFEAPYFNSIAQMPRDRFGPAKMSVHARRLYPGEKTSELLWNEMIEGMGCGAIAHDRRVVIAMSDGRFLVFPADGTTASHPPLADAKLAFHPDDISLGDAGAVLFHRTHDATATVAIDANGRELWRASVPFVATQPPVDGARGRVFVVGHGIAAIEGGRTLFSVPSGIPHFATTFDDGSLAVGVGTELRLADRDGQSRQTLRTAHGDAIVAPPAIAPDGAIWIATAKALYVAR